jgi:hypothetical protein
MSEGGTVKARLEKAEEALQAELKTWTELRLRPQGWRMGDEEFMFRCEQLTVAKLIKEKLGLTDEELQLEFKKVTLEQLQQLRPQVVAQQAEIARAAIMAGIPKPDIIV